MRSSKIVGVFLCLFAIVTLASAGPENLGIRDVYQITFHTPVHVGNAVLPAGDYTVRHEMEGQDHYMVFRRHERLAPDVKVKCMLVQLGYKARETSTKYLLNAANEKVLQEIEFKGDTAKHVF